MQTPPLWGKDKRDTGAVCSSACLGPREPASSSRARGAMANNADMWANVGGKGHPRTPETVFPPHLMYAFYAEVGYNSLLLIVSIVLGLSLTDGEGFAWWIWSCIIFGVPWWGTGTCGVTGACLPMIQCCSPTCTIKTATALLITSGSVILCINALGMITTEGGIGRGIVTSGHGPGTVWYALPLREP